MRYETEIIILIIIIIIRRRRATTTTAIIINNNNNNNDDNNNNNNNNYHYNNINNKSCRHTIFDVQRRFRSSLFQILDIKDIRGYQQRILITTEDIRGQNILITELLPEQN